MRSLSVVAELPGVRRFVGVEQVWSYANTGYWLAGAPGGNARRARPSRTRSPRACSGRPGLESTSFGEPELEGTGPDALAGPYPRARRPSGGLVSNVPDLLRFGEWHLAQPESARLRIAHGKPTGGVYGLGLFGERVGGIEVWGHGGSYGGFQSSLLVVPERSAVFVGLTNSSVGRPGAARARGRVLRARARGAAARAGDRGAAVRRCSSRTRARTRTATGGYEVAPASDGLVVTFEDGEFAARPIGERTFEITEGTRIGERFDFPLEGFGRFGSRLAERVA